MARVMDGKAGLVTGAASGIGRACALRFAEEGASVVVADLESSRAGGEETVRMISDVGGRAATMTPRRSNESPERQQQILRPQAMSRFGNPAEVAAAVVWLCSDDAGFVTGVSMPVDAGSVAGW